MPLAPGTKLGPYEILSALGAGGIGEVYRARDTRLDRSVAIKILPAHLSADSTRKLRFEREAKTVSALNHPNICSLFDVGSQDGTDFLVMERIEGENLADRLAKGPLPMEQVLKIGTEIADAIEKAHRSGVVHRDLKPGNIMLTKTGAKLLDFGLAKPAVASSSGLTLTDVPASSPVIGQGVIADVSVHVSRAGRRQGTRSRMAEATLNCLWPAKARWPVSISRSRPSHDHQAAHSPQSRSRRPPLPRQGS